jgi:hypothetical protein
MTSLTTTARGFESLLDLSRTLTRGIDAPLPEVSARTDRPQGIAVTLARVGERWAHARAAEAWLELARHDHRMARELKAALLRAR